VSWCHGTAIAAASSRDGRDWLYRGTLAGLDPEPGRNTLWAPDAVWDGERYHAFVSWIRGVPDGWHGDARMVHAVSDDLFAWRVQSVLALSSARVIDAGLCRLPGGTWRMWYKDEGHGAQIWAADSADLARWTVVGPVLTDRAQEAPTVFAWRGHQWMVTDFWSGIAVHRSDDGGHSWTRQADLLDRPGRRAEDGSFGGHPDVVVQGDAAWIVYQVHPGQRGDRQTPTFTERRTVLQVAALGTAGGGLTCDRDAAVDFALAPG
jgi:hypothetical protein